jgi:hypothetical protein
MPLIDDNDRKAHQEHLKEQSEKQAEGLGALMQLLPTIKSDIVRVVKEAFRIHGKVQSCSKFFWVDASVAHIPIEQCRQILHTALAEALELPTSKFTIYLEVINQVSSSLDITLVFDPPLS